MFLGELQPATYIVEWDTHMSKLIKRYRRHSYTRAVKHPDPLFAVEIGDVMSDLSTSHA